MRHVWLCTVLCAVSATTGHARANASGDQSTRTVLTIVLEFRGPHGARSVEEMEREVENILRGAGRAIEWRSWEQATQAVFDELAVVRFTGRGLADRAFSNFRNDTMASVAAAVSGASSFIGGRRNCGTLCPVGDIHLVHIEPPAYARAGGAPRRGLAPFPGRNPEEISRV